MSTRFANRPMKGFRPIKSPKRHAAKVRAWKAESGRYGMTKARRPDCGAACGWKTDGNGYAYVCDDKCPARPKAVEAAEPAA